jgi:hypothetical protein
LEVCAECRHQVAVQRTVRTVLRARAATFSVSAPPGLRTRIEARLAPSAPPRLSWAWRLSAFGAAAAAVLVLTVGLEFIPVRSSVLLAAQLAVDHVRCFVLEMGSTADADAAAVERWFADEYGWRVAVPPSNEAVGLTLVAVRRCPFWLGDHAHLLYRSRAHEVSLYVTPGDTRPSARVTVLGHAERIWSAGDASFVLVARGLPDTQLAPIADYLVTATEARTPR